MEFRYNPLLDWWAMFAASRENRPLMPEDRCPFCPGSENVPDKYDVYLYPNDFPIMELDAPEMTKGLFDLKTDNKDLKQKVGRLYKTKRSYGLCDIILYSSEHKGKLYDLSNEHIQKLINLWVQRFEEMSKQEKIKYVFIFENRGEAVGVTISHPHGQIYGYSFMPKKIELELNNSRLYYEKHKCCMFCDIIETEKAMEKRFVYENSSFIAVVPFFAEYPYQVYIYLKSHKQTLLDFSDKEKKDMGNILKMIVKMYDKIFDMEFPYMMCFHQAPVDDGDYDYYHFHIEFYPPLRNKLTQKFNASSETGAWVSGDPASPEQKANEMREIIRNMGSEPH